MVGTLHITGDPEADDLLNTDPNALLIGMLLDQQVPMGWAFTGPSTLRARLGHLDPARIAAMDVEAFVEVCRRRPAVHRFPASMGERVHALCVELSERWDADASRLWAEVDDADVVRERLRELPGFGDEKSRIFVALLAKTQGVAPDGWRRAAGAFGDDEPRSAADAHDEASLARVREWKRAQKAARLDKQDRPIG